MKMRFGSSWIVCAAAAVAICVGPASGSSVGPASGSSIGQASASSIGPASASSIGHASASSIGQASASGLDAAFEILRKGDRIGDHFVDVEQLGEETTVRTRIKMRVKFGPLTVYRYDHEAEEIWRDGVVARIDSRTNDNGEKASLKVRREGDQLLIEGSGFTGAAPLAVAPSSYWNRSLVSASALLNTQNGEIIPVKTAALGVTTTPGGARAEQFHINGTVGLNIWYDGPRWVGSNFKIDGEELTYRPIATRAVKERFASLEAD
jgi:hypothetical protein